MSSTLTHLKAELLKRDIFDTRYDAAGTKVWLPTGLKIRKAYLDHCRRLFEKFDFTEYMFPSIVSKPEIEKVFANVKDFSRGVIPISKQAYLSPTGEAIIYPMVKLWLEDGKRLPLKIFQINNLFRSRKPRGLLRDNQEDTFVEAHTIHSSRAEAEIQHARNIEFLDNLLSDIALPVIKSVRPLFGNNPVAEEVIGYDALLPIGEALQVASTYKQMQTFSKAFEIRYKGELTYHTTFGFSSKMLIAALFGYLRQEGYVLPGSIAPVAVAICPIVRNASSEDIESHARAAHVLITKADSLRDKIKLLEPRNQFRDNIDFLDELAVPIVIEVSDDEVAGGTYTLSDRLDKTKMIIRNTDLVEAITNAIKRQNGNIFSTAKAQVDKNIHRPKSLNELAEIVKSGRVAYCALENSIEALKALQRHTFGEALGFNISAQQESPCLVTGRPTLDAAWISRRV